MRSAHDHDQVQAERWRRADPRAWAWKTGGPYFADSEAELVAWIEPRGRLLEVGCGEGSNLHHLRRRATSLFAVDRSIEKVSFARAHLSGLRAVAADAAHLPFADGSFDTVFVRDVLHHVIRRDVVLAELWRVLRPGGRLGAIEANPRTPLFLAYALLSQAERGLLGCTPTRLMSELRALPGAGPVELSMSQPLLLARAVLHPDLGWPALGGSRLVRAVLDALAACGAHIVPRSAWAYARARVDKSQPVAPS